VEEHGYGGSGLNERAPIYMQVPGLAQTSPDTLMSTTISARFPVSFVELKGLSAQEVKFGLIAVLTFIAGTCLYCLSYQAWVMAVTPNLFWTVAIVLRDWGVWFLLTPMAFRIFGILDARARWRQQLIAGVALAFVAALVPTVFDQLSGTRSLISSLVLFWPRFLAMTLVIYLLWRVLPKPSASASIEARSATELVQPVRPETLLVSKGADQCLIRLCDIQHAAAAGNYIELRARDQQYLIRSTMARLEELLPPCDYVRIHRSHLVRVDQIERIRMRRSSNGIVHLRSGHTLPLSKTCRSELLKHKLDSSPG
jgi:two-component system LytT family response regulator